MLCENEKKVIKVCVYKHCCKERIEEIIIAHEK